VIHLYCYFDYHRGKHRPLYACSYDDKSQKADFYPLYFPMQGLPLFTAYKNEQKVKALFDGPLVLSGFKSFVSAFKLDPFKEYQIYDASLPIEATPDFSGIKKAILKKIAVLIKHKPSEWSKALVNAQLVYKTLEDRGYYYGNDKKYPIYDFAYTGRSKCIKNNIQGATVNDEIYHINDEFDVFIHFDWVAADFRVASLISGDDSLEESFKTSDPYTRLAEELGDPEITREQCKLELFRSFYSMNPDAAPLEFYPQFSEWMKNSIAKIERNGYSLSLLGRKFQMGTERTLKSAFNAQIQGTVAHAMQNVIWQVHQKFPENILTEVHDSLILCARPKDAPEIIRGVSEVMLYPLNGISNVDAKFPIKISLGTKWKKWKPYKELR